ncbi:PQQ-binding-like beta-propeller repeat protein [Streptomyces sp. G45]|uniref:outer membrane protein assembly factor BamB family protein n=1 Tax=Streptomyces sp. G45 TaxID=3406627 RepID=UPI003C254724
MHAPASAASTGGTVHAVRTADGTRRWQRDGGAGAPPKLWGVVDGLLLAPDALAEALDVRTGEPWPVPDAWPGTTLWYAVAGRRLATLHRVDGVDRYELRLRTLPDGSAPRTRKSAPHWHRPAALGSALLLAPEPGTLVDDVTCLDAATGNTRWTYDGLGSDAKAVAAPLALPGRGGRAARFALLSDTGDLHLVAARDGKRLARRALGIAAGRGTTALGQARGTGLVLGGGRLVAFDPDDGAVRWNRPTAGLAASWPSGPGGAAAPVTADGVLLHWADPGTLEAVDLADGGRRLWAAAFDATAQCPPAVGGGVVYVTAGRECRALPPRGGAPLARWRLDAEATALAADASGWYALLGGRSVRAVNAPSV